jgi:hypothetical protein
MLNRYIIERKIPGVGESSEEDYSKLAGKSNEALSKLSPKVQWVQSFVTNDKVYCEYLAENEDVVREHAKMVGIPADTVSKVVHVCDPTTASEFDVSKASAQKSSVAQEKSMHS